MRVLKDFCRRDLLRAGISLMWSPRQCIGLRAGQITTKHTEVLCDPTDYQRKIFSGIQPTGSLHLGNYLGAVRKWAELQDAKEDVTFCIVDLHSLTVRQEPVTLRENIFQMAAALLACGIDPDRSTIFVQSAVKEHAELAWILGCSTTMARLGHLPQYKEKTRLIKDVPLGLFVYPVLQAADILLYKATHIPVGEDQLQHIQLAQHLARNFNTQYGPTFPICHALIEDKTAARIRSLRDPSKKMSKSDGDPRSVINLTDEPDVIKEKVKKAVTDFCSDVHYNPDTRQGVSNLIAIHSMLTGLSIEKIIAESSSIDTGKYKLRVAEVIADYLHPIRNKINQQLARRKELVYLLETGAEKARETASQTLSEVKQRLGLGAHPNMPVAFEPKEEYAPKPVAKPQQRKIEIKKLDIEIPIVPKQQLRVEKTKQFRIEIKPDSVMDIQGSQGKLDVKPVVQKQKQQSEVTLAVPVVSKPSTPKKTADEKDTTHDKHTKEIKL